MRARYTVAGKKRRDRTLKLARGYHGARSIRIKAAKEAVMHALRYAYVDRRKKKRNYRRLWITRISAFVRPEGITYSRFIEGLYKANISINRKVLSNIAISDPELMREYVKIAKKAVGIK